MKLSASQGSGVPQHTWGNKWSPGDELCSQVEALLLKVWSTDQQQHHLGAGYKCRIISPTSDLLNLGYIL